MDKEKVTDRLKGMCSRREYCRADVMKKALAALDGDSEAAKKVVETLVSEKYVDDLRYASAFARDKSVIAGWGDVKIRYMLSSKGIPKDIVQAALSEKDTEKAAGKLSRLIETKARSLEGDQQMKMKLLRFALGRGYEYEEVAPVVDNYMKTK